MKARPNKRPTIGFIIDLMESRYQQRVWPGIVAVAEENDFNLVIFPGKTSNWQGFDHQTSVIYEFIHKNNIDGLVIASGTLSTTMSHNEVVTFIKKFVPIPVVSLAIDIDDVPSIVVTNKEGMMEAVNHLIDHHHYRKIAFIRGPESNSEAEERFQAYLDSLSRHGIQIDYNRIANGDFTFNAGVEAMRQFVELRKLKLDAVVTANDDMARGVAHYCQQKKIRIPEDVALTGFDDVEEVQYYIPPISSVRQPLYEEARLATEMIVKAIQGKKMDQKTVIPARFVTRSSCGCLPELISQMQSKELMPPANFSALSKKEKHSHMLQTAIASTEDPKQKEAVRNWIEKTVIGLLSEDIKEFDLTKLLDEFNRTLIDDIWAGRDIRAWQNVISILTNFILDGVKDSVVLERMTRLLSGARLIIGDRMELVKVIDRFKLWTHMENFHYLMQKLINRISIDSLLKIVVEELPKLVPSFYLFLYEREWEHPHGHPWQVPESAKFMIGYSDNGVILPNVDNQFLHRDDFIPYFLFPKNRRYTMILKPLYFRDKHFGFIYCEMGEKQTIVYEILRLQISSVLNSSVLTSNEQIAEMELLEANLKLTESNRKLEEMDRLKTDFFSNISHELRTPLTLILGPIESLLAGDYGPNIQNTDEKIVSIYNNAQMLLKLLNTLLDFAKIEAGKMDLKLQKNDIFQLIKFYHSNIVAAAESLHIRITIETELEELIASVDRDLFEKAFFNLVSNSLKFTPEGGHISIILKQDPDKRYFSISIKDSGVGIAQDKLDKLFERFGKTGDSASGRFEGTGIGLAFTNEIVKMHKGEMKVESELGKGSTFTMILPVGGDGDKGKEVNRTLPEIKSTVLSELVLQNITVKKIIAQEGKKTLRSNKKTIILVDDNITLCQFVKSLLEKEFDVLFFTNGHSAYEMAKIEKPAIIITDIMMPETDGYALAKMVKSDPELHNTPLIFLTAKSEVEMKIEALEYGADDYISKPFHSRELIARVNNILKNKELESELIHKQKQIDSDFIQASLVQRSILTQPSFYKAISELDIDVQYLPMNGTISGDYYNISRQHSGSISILLSDTTGHGLQAALSTMQIDLLNKESLNMKYPDERLEYINKKLTEVMPTKNLISCFMIGILADKIYYSSASHPNQFLIRSDRTIVPLTSKGIMLGIQNDLTFELKEEKCGRGDVLFLFSDGIYEEFNANDEEFGLENLQKFIQEMPGDLSPETINRNVLKKVEEFRGGTPINDDITLICLKIR